MERNLAVTFTRGLQSQVHRKHSRRVFNVPVLGPHPKTLIPKTALGNLPEVFFGPRYYWGNTCISSDALPGLRTNDRLSTAKKLRLSEASHSTEIRLAWDQNI